MEVYRKEYIHKLNHKKHLGDTMTEKRNVIIIGSGPSGFTSAIYTARAQLQPLVFEGKQPGGQLTTTTEIENFPGFKDGIMGPELMDTMREQAKRFGAEFKYESISKVDFSQKPFKLWAGETEYSADSVIIATGASARMLGLPNEADLVGRGVSTCATCDGFFYREKEIIIVGGGDSAMEEAIFLTKFASKVYISHRRDEFRASKIMQERAINHPKIEILYSTVIDEYVGTKETGLTSVKLKDTKTGEIKDMKIDGVFIAIGHVPNTKFLEGQINIDEKGYIITKPGTPLTNVEGVFAAGDVHDQTYRQGITAAGFGCQAAITTERWLENNE